MAKKRTKVVKHYTFRQKVTRFVLAAGVAVIVANVLFLLNDTRSDSSAKEDVRVEIEARDREAANIVFQGSTVRWEEVDQNCFGGWRQDGASGSLIEGIRCEAK